MFARQAGYLATARERGFALPATYDDHADAWAEVRRALAAAPRPTVPCNNDLLAANYLDDGERVWLIDYEYSGNNEACFELGNTATECEFSDEMTEAWTSAYFGTPTRADLARVRLFNAGQRLRLVALGLHPGGHQPDRLRLPRVGHGALRARRGDLPRPGLPRSAGGRRAWLTSRSRAEVVVVGGGVIGASVAYHLPSSARPTCCSWSRATSPAVRRGTRPGSSARCGRARAAPGWCSTPPSSTTRSRPRPGWPPATATSAA